jgi:carbamoyl-phosphate synthase small subunit
MITAQNHGFVVDEQTLPECLRATHVSLFDGAPRHARTDRPAFSFQGHPEASPGPHDCACLFDHFIELMTASRLRGQREPPKRNDLQSILILGAGPSSSAVPG